MDFDFRGPLLLLANLLLLSLLRLLNDALGPMGLTLFLPALFLLEPALVLRLRWALLVAGLTGLAFDAYSPLPFGFSLVLFAAMTTLLFANRQGLRRASAWQHLWVLLAINALLWLVMTISMGRPWLGESLYWERSLADLVVSSVLLFPIGAWFLSVQRMLVELTGREFDTEMEG